MSKIICAQQKEQIAIDFQRAAFLERAGRFEEAAILYEKHGLWDRAGSTRAKGRQVAIKSTNISLDINSLLKQISDGGIVAIYRCPNCGGKLKVSKNTTLSSLKVCEHCNSEIQTMDLVDFLKTALS